MVKITTDANGQQAFYWLVGIDGTSTPDPRYWFDRWEVVGPYVSKEEAVAKWCLARTGWLADEEKKYIKVWDRKAEFFSFSMWERDNIIWGPDRYQAKLKVKAWEDRR